MGVTLQCQCESLDEDLHHLKGVKGGKFEDEEQHSKFWFTATNTNVQNV